MKAQMSLRIMFVTDDLTERARVKVYSGILAPQKSVD